VSVTRAEDLDAAAVERAKTAPLPEVSASAWAAAIDRAPSLRAAPWLRSLGRAGVRLAFVATHGDHPAWKQVWARARRLHEDGVAMEPFDLGRVDRLQLQLDHARTALAEAGTPPEAERARAVVVELASDAEVLRWRLAIELAYALGGSRADARVSTWPDALLGDPELELARLEPPDPRYGVVKSGLQKLRARVEAARGRGGEGLPLVAHLARLRPGARDRAVSALRQRLAALGFEAGEGDRLDDRLLDVLATFQARHHLPASGRLDSATLHELGVPLEARIASVVAVMERLRTGSLAAHPDRVVVQIPAFELELVRGHRVVLRSRVVVGAGRVSADATGGIGHLDRTPVLESTIHTIVLNPAWAVPRRIKELELDPRAASDPTVYDGFELIAGADGVERAVQLPGPHNALGRLKFVFEGGDGVYLHDTPKRKVFAEPYRALSHGCVRVERAFDLARELLAIDAHPLAWAEAERILARGQQAQVGLGRPIPVFLEYQTAGVEEGELVFYPDVYGPDVYAVGRR
jgi:murein L,D-transpeptidase YcbB/YkuD